MDQEDAAIEAAWCYLLREDLEVPWAEIVERVRRQCPGVEVARVRAEFDRRLRARCGLSERPAEAPEEVLEGTGAPLNVGSANVPATSAAASSKGLGAGSGFSPSSP